MGSLAGGCCPPPSIRAKQGRHGKQGVLPSSVSACRLTAVRLARLGTCAGLGRWGLWRQAPPSSRAGISCCRPASTCGSSRWVARRLGRAAHHELPAASAGGAAGARDARALLARWPDCRLPAAGSGVQPDGAGALRGLASMVEFSGQTNPLLASTPIKAATRVSELPGGRQLRLPLAGRRVWRTCSAGAPPCPPAHAPPPARDSSSHACMLCAPCVRCRSPAARACSTAASRCWPTTSRYGRCRSWVSGGGVAAAWHLGDPACPWLSWVLSICLPARRVPPFPLSASDWLPGESQTFYVYHQMATGELYNIKCDAPKLKSTGLPLVSCLQVREGAWGPRQGCAGSPFLRHAAGRCIPPAAASWAPACR